MRVLVGNGPETFRSPEALHPEYLVLIKDEHNHLSPLDNLHQLVIVVKVVVMVGLGKEQVGFVDHRHVNCLSPLIELVDEGSWPGKILFK